MAMKKIPIAEATAAQLRTFAREVCGLPDVKDTANKQTLVAQIQAAWEHDFILASDEERTSKERSSKNRFADETPEKHPETVVVLIHGSEEPGGDRPVELGVNGQNMLVERNKDQEIPWAFFIALQNAEQHFHDPMPVNDQSNGGINPVPRKVMRYPFTRVA